MADDFARVATVIEATGEEGPFPIVVPRSDPLSNTAKGEFRFGPFRLLVKERRLERDRQIVPLGSRALDILAALVGRAGEVVNKRELTEAAWPGLIVEEGSLRFHVASLRRALGERAEGQPYLTTVAGRGYCFTAELSHDPMPASPSGNLAKDVRFPANLRRSFGMDVAAAAAAAELMEWRFLTLVGPPGIGKTRLAIQLGHQLAERFSDGAVFIDFGSVSGPHLVPNAIAAAIGRLLPPDQALDGLLALLRGKQMLIVLDGCEHIIDAVAEFAERLFGQAPTITILATSRESLRVDGERVYRLFPLACPSETQGLTAEEALKFPAVQLFVDRTRAGQAGFAVSDEEAPFVSEICRKLDGIPLALELAAGRVPSYGIKQTASLLDGRFRLLWQGRRTAPPRHQTLSAALDWSYDLLSLSERQVLRRVSVFAGLFTLDAARAVAADGVMPAETVVAVLADLVAKSLVVREEGTSDARYRLLDTTRVYGLAKLLATEEAATIVRRHAIHLRDLLVVETRSDVLARPKANPYDDRIGNVRTALQWSFSTGQDDALAVSLAAVAGPLFLELSLADECLEWTKRGLSALSPADLGGMIEAKLQAAYGLALLALGGCGEEIERAFRRGHDIARKAGDSYQTFRFLGGLHVLQIRLGNITAALAVAEQARDAAGLVADPAALSMADAMLAVSHHFGGNHIAARGHKVAALSQPSASARVTNMQFGIDHRSRIKAMQARDLWLQGDPDGAYAAARDAIEETARLGNPSAHALSLVFNGMIFFWQGDVAAAQELVAHIVDHADRHLLRPYMPIGLGMQGILEIHRGRPEQALPRIAEALARLHKLRFGVLISWFLGALAEGEAKMGRSAEALAHIDEALALVARDGNRFVLPELLRLKGEILASYPPSLDRAAACLLEAVACAQKQAAPAWASRALLSYARVCDLQRCSTVADSRLHESQACRSITEGERSNAFQPTLEKSPDGATQTSLRLMNSRMPSADNSLP